ncbi:MAG TPA: hypothetical protein VEC16_03195 [Alphaproteobacteria bacterium]|nr:hypothetical protein [Alphaproteobacteria bacterium]
MNAEELPLFFVMVKSEENYYIVLESKDQIYCRLEYEDIVSDFPKIYGKKGGNYFSGLIDRCNIRPSIIKMNLSDLESKLFDIEKGVALYNIKTKSGTMLARECNGKADLKKLYEKGYPDFALKLLKDYSSDN